MKSTHLLPLLLTLTTATTPADHPGPDVVATASISVTAYDSPWSSGDSTWTVPTTVSYHTGANYTSMLTPSGSATGTAAAASGTEHAGKTGSGSASETAAKATGTGAEPFEGAAAVGMRVLGVGEVLGVVVAVGVGMAWGL